MNNPTAFIDDAATALRVAEVPSANFVNGVNAGGSNSPGIGIATDNPGLAPSLPSWTLLDQHGNAREGQIGQNQGGLGYSDPGTSSGTEGTLPDSTIRVADPLAFSTPIGNGNPGAFLGNATLSDLAAGWIFA